MYICTNIAIHTTQYQYQYQYHCISIYYIIIHHYGIRYSIRIDLLQHNRLNINIRFVVPASASDARHSIEIRPKLMKQKCYL